MTAAINSFKNRAISYVVKTREDEGFNETIEVGMQASEDNKKSAYFTYLAMLAVHGAEAMNGFPRIGTTNDPKKKGEGNFDDNNPDQYVTTSAGGEAIRGSFVNDYADNTMKGMEVSEVLQHIKDKDGAFKSMGDSQIKREKNKYSQRLQSIRTMVRNAIAFHHAMADANNLAGVEVTLEKVVSRNEKGEAIKNADGTFAMEYADATEPVVVKDITREGHLRYFSLKGFLKLDADKAALKGGDWESFINSAARGTKNNQEQGNPDNVVIDKLERFDSGVSSMVTYINGIKGDTGKLKHFLSFLRKPDNASLVSAIFDLEEVLSLVTQAKEFQHIRDKYETEDRGEKQAA